MVLDLIIGTPKIWGSQLLFFRERLSQIEPVVDTKNVNILGSIQHLGKMEKVVCNALVIEFIWKKEDLGITFTEIILRWIREKSFRQ